MPIHPKHTKHQHCCPQETDLLSPPMQANSTDISTPRATDLRALSHTTTPIYTTHLSAITILACITTLYPFPLPHARANQLGKKHAPAPAAAKSSKPSNAQLTQTIEISGGQGDTFEIDLLHEDEWAEELVTHMDKGFDSWEDAGTHLFSGDNMWSSALSEDDDFVSTIAFHNIDGISCDAGINESLLDHLRCNSSTLCIGDTRTDARNVSRKTEVPCLAKLISAGGACHSAFRRWPIAPQQSI